MDPMDPMDPAEQIVSDAIMSGDTETGLRQITCNAAASSKMICECGNILDQRTVHVLEAIQDGKEKALAACCKSCAVQYSIKAATLATAGKKQGISYRWQTLAKTIPIEPIVNMEFVHVGENGSVATGTPVFKRTTARPAVPKKPDAPKKERIPSIFQIVRGKDQSERLKPLAIAVLEKHGIAMNSGTMILAGLPHNPKAIVAEGISERVEMWAKKSRDLISQPIDESEELGRGHFVQLDNHYCCRMIGKKTGKHVCTVSDMLRRAAEKHRNVRRWFASVAIAERDNWKGPSAIIGLNTAGERVAVIVCVVDEGGAN